MGIPWIAVLLPLGAALAARVEPPPGLSIVSNTGLVVVTYRHESWLGGKEATLPIYLPPGSELTVLEGRVRVEGCGVTVRATEGDSFAYHSFPEFDCASPIHLAATGEASGLELQVGEETAFLGGGDAVSIVPVTRGVSEVHVLAGLVDFKSPEGETFLSAGQMLVARAAPPARRGVAKAPASVAKGEAGGAIVQPDERLRSAPAGLAGRSLRFELPALAGAAGAAGLVVERARGRATVEAVPPAGLRAPLPSAYEEAPLRRLLWPAALVATGLALLLDRWLRRLRRGR